MPIRGSPNGVRHPVHSRRKRRLAFPGIARACPPPEGSSIARKSRFPVHPAHRLEAIDQRNCRNRESRPRVSGSGLYCLASGAASPARLSPGRLRPRPDDTLVSSSARGGRSLRPFRGRAGTRLGLRKARILLELLDFALEFRFVLKAIVTGQATHDFAAFPILEDTAQVFASNSSYGREVALPDLVLNDDAVRSDIPPKMIRQFEQRDGQRDLAATGSSQRRPPRWSHVGVG